jgi:hypothetical protein
MEVRTLSNIDDYCQMFDIFYSRNKFAGRTLDRKLPLETFIEKVSKNLITYGYFENDQLKSFLSSKLLKEIPSWYVYMIGIKKEKNIFDLEKTGLSLVVDHCLSYWEQQGINSIIFIQSIKHRAHINGINISEISEKMKEYTNPAATLEIIKKGERSEFSLIKSLMQDNVFPTDIVVKMSFKKDLFKDYV